MTFDYSGLASPAPSGFKVLAAGPEFHVKHKPSGREYLIQYIAGEHHLYAKSKLRPTDKPEFLIRTDNLRRCLIALGWVKIGKGFDPENGELAGQNSPSRLNSPTRKTD